jgi:hypothetical protein
VRETSSICTVRRETPLWTTHLLYYYYYLCISRQEYPEYSK